MAKEESIHASRLRISAENHGVVLCNYQLSHFMSGQDTAPGAWNLGWGEGGGGSAVCYLLHQCVIGWRAEMRHSLKINLDFKL